MRHLAHLAALENAGGVELLGSLGVWFRGRNAFLARKLRPGAAYLVRKFRVGFGIMSARKSKRSF